MPQTVIWTVLPNGVDGSKLKVSLYVSLRAVAGAAPPDWPAAVRGLSGLTLQFDDAAATQVALTFDRNLPSSDLWNRAFPPSSVTVREYSTRNYAERPRISYPIREIKTAVERVYKDTAERFGNTTPLETESEGSENSSELGQLRSDIFFPLRRLERGDQPDQQFFDDPFYKAYRFYRRELDNTPNADVPLPAVPDPDLHEALGMLGDQPYLLRAFGLVIDATFTASSVPASATRVRLVAPTSVSGSETPWTSFTRDGGAFLPAPQDTNGDLKAGFVKLGDTQRFEIHQLDIDSAALKLITFAMAEVDNNRVDGYELPNLRTAGFVVGRVDRSSAMGARFQRSNELEGSVGSGGTSTTLYAEDLLRGYRLDVNTSYQSQQAAWYSLSKRKGSYLLGTGSGSKRVPAQGEIHDEGYSKASAATSHADADPNDPATPMYVHEALVGWDGWSQVVAPPGRALVFDHGALDQGKPPEGLADVSNEPATKIKVEPRFKVEPSSLPKLRFGASYRLRARAVDLAGNSLPLSAQTDDSALVTTAQTFLRYEPVPSPVLVLRRKVVEGESLEHVVIRTRSGDSGAKNVFFSSNDRHLAPPSTNLELVLQHGMLDGMFNDPTRSFNLAAKSEGTFLDREIWDKNGHKKKVNGIEIVSSPSVQAPAAFPEHRGDPLLPGQYVIHKDEKLALPYLPDPLAVGAALFDARDLEPTRPKVGVCKRLFSGTWPDIEPCKIVVTATDQPTPSIKVEGSNFVIRMPQGTMLPLRYGSLISKDKLETVMALWQLMDADKRAELLEDALEGNHWMITPQRELMIVHAVERPLAPASFDAISIAPARKLGETFVDLELLIKNHSHSTGQLDVEAHWAETVDRLSDPGPTQDVRDGHVLTCRPTYEDSVFKAPPEHWYEAGDTPRHELGDTKHRYVEYRPDASTRYREYFPPSVTADRAAITLQGEITELNIPSTARPDIPQVLYVVPTFRWESNDDDCNRDHGHGTNGNHHPSGPTTSKRVGRGLRVYLARPWFSSGDGELLGVVIPESGPLADDAAARRYVSEWGSDPLWRGTGPSTQLAPSHFSNAIASNTGPLSIAEESGVSVGVVAFDVEYNQERQVWFADIEMADISSYFPFVRLALCRYQPDSIEGAHLSRISRAEFIQLVNDRAATVSVGANALTVSVSGIAAHNQLGDTLAASLPAPPATPPTAPPGYQYDRAAGAGRIVTAQLESLPPNGGDLDWTAVGSATTLAAFSPTGGGPEVLWTGDVARPSKKGPHHTYRLVLKEVEVFATDADVSQPLSVGTTDPVRGRVVYLDTIPLSKIEI